MARSVLLLLVILASSGVASLIAQEHEGEIVRSGIASEVAAESQVDSPYSGDNDSSYAVGSLSDDGQEAAESNVNLASGSSPAILPANRAKPLQLASRTRPDKASAVKSSLAKPTESLITIGGSLCVVLSIFFGLAWLTRRGLPKGMGKLPGEVIEVLGKTPLVKGQELQLVRVGTKLLLICVTPTGCETLTEIVELGEVDRLSTICRANGPASMTTAFNQVLTGIGREPAAGFAGSARTPSVQRGGRARA